MSHRFTRRTAVSLAAVTATAGIRAPQLVTANPVPSVVVSVDADADMRTPFDRRDHGVVGVYDVDWLLSLRYERLLDNLSASPGAVHGVRFFGAFTAGERERISPEGGGTVWPSLDQAPDFSITFAALEALMARGLTPFVVLSFFPPAVSASPIHPPNAWVSWMSLVRAFFAELIVDPRFGAERIREWWFEVWNEPNQDRFWLGTQDDYLALYRATSEAVAESGVSIRLGGPAIAYKPEEDPDAGPPWLDRFLHFIAADPTLQCDFISIHSKGTVTNDPPDPRRLITAAITTADQMRAIDPIRFAGLPIINNEADEKVGFEIPYQPRVDHRNAAWLNAVTASHAALTDRYQASRYRFMTAADNANLHLVEAPFDGRRSLMTRANVSGSDTDLLKTPAYGSYEMLRITGAWQGRVVSGAEHLFPATDLYHLTTFGNDGIAVLLTHYPDPSQIAPVPVIIEVELHDIPWPRINLAQFQIDSTHSNAYAAAGGSLSTPYPVPDPADLPQIRLAQELGLLRPIARNLTPVDGRYSERIRVEIFTTTCLWITPHRQSVVEAPVWQEISVEDGNVLVRWQPNREPWWYAYDLAIRQENGQFRPVGPDPLRAALWVDTAPPLGQRAYAVRAVSASGDASPWAMSDPIQV